MPEGFLGIPRLTNIGPISRATKEELREKWDTCPRPEREREICETIKFHAVDILENQGVFAECEDLVDINSGRCHDIAQRVSDELDYVTYVETFGGDHGWIRYDGRHYDAEVPTGVEDPFNLPFFGRISATQVLDWAREEARMMGEEPPGTFHDMIVEVE